MNTLIGFVMSMGSVRKQISWWFM